MSMRCPLYPKKRTLLVATRMSALCQKQTFCAAVELALVDHLVGGGEQRRRAPSSNVVARTEELAIRLPVGRTVKAKNYSVRDRFKTLWAEFLIAAIRATARNKFYSRSA